MTGRIFHIATRADWEAATRSGNYTTSTVGRSLEDEGFIHASRADQVQGVFDRYYRDLPEPLVLLSVSPLRLSNAEVREEPVGGDVYPHIYGPINRGAVVDVRPLDKRGRPLSFTKIFFFEMALRSGLGLLAMALAFGGAAAAERLSDAESARLAGALAGLVLGVGVAVVVLRRRR